MVEIFAQSSVKITGILKKKIAKNKIYGKEERRYYLDRI